jgi:hypothetical protein
MICKRTLICFVLSSFSLCSGFAFTVNCANSEPKRFHCQRRISMASQRTSACPPFSKKIEKTLDPCVVLVKEMIGSYAAEWEGRGGIYSLAQGVVYWKPPDTTQVALAEALSRSDEPDDMLHMYGPDEGVLELREALEQKLRTENNLSNHHELSQLEPTRRT